LAKELEQSQLKPDDTTAVPRTRFSEVGYGGLKINDKQLSEEANKKLRMPHLIKEIDEMKKDSSVSAALNFYKLMLGRVEWDVSAPVGASPKQKERAAFVKTCMHDMSHSWFDFITSVLSCVDYGYSINEKVYKRRFKANSKYDDGLIGWKKLPSRSQSTCYRWIYSEDGRELTGIEQSLENLYNQGRIINIQSPTGSFIEIPKEKFLLFRTSPQNDNPEGTASLKSAWISWRYKKAIEEQEMLGIGRDLGGLLSVGIPARYMSPDASDAEKAVYEEYKRVVRNVAKGEQSGIIVPSDVDPESKQRLFELDLLTSDGGKSYDTNLIVQRYTNQMLISLFADLLQLGNNGSGSFALSGSKQELIEFALDYRLKELANVLNNDLIPSLFKMNRWEDTEYPKFTYGSIQKVDLETLSKYVQRVAAVSAIEKDREFYNLTRTAIGLKPFSEDEPIHKDELNEDVSRSGDSMNTPSGGANGTGKGVSKDDNSVSNAENA
jgi:hypothetical protein